MNIQTANKLMELRKEKGYTQESLADALGISRQAVSKWERAEASPDTDNLICLAKLYGVSLDELLDIENASYEEVKEEQIKEDGDKVHIGKDGIHVYDKDGSEVHIDLKGINVSDNGDNVHVGFDGIRINEEKESKRAQELVWGIVSSLSLVAYLLLGFIGNLWHPAWLIFLLIPVLSSIGDCIVKKKVTAFNYPVAVTVIYLFLGFMYNLWHPYWALFISIPVFYMVFDPIEKLWKRKETISINLKDDEE